MIWCLAGCYRGNICCIPDINIQFIALLNDWVPLESWKLPVVLLLHIHVLYVLHIVWNDAFGSHSRPSNCCHCYVFLSLLNLDFSYRALYAAIFSGSWGTWFHMQRQTRKGQQNQYGQLQQLQGNHIQIPIRSSGNPSLAWMYLLVPLLHLISFPTGRWSDHILSKQLVMPSSTISTILVFAAHVNCTRLENFASILDWDYSYRILSTPVRIPHTETPYFPSQLLGDVI